MNPEVPPSKKDYPSTFKEYKEESKGKYSPEALTHFFNNEFGTAVNILAVIETRLARSEFTPQLRDELLTRLAETRNHLSTAHEIGNISLDLL